MLFLREIDLVKMECRGKKVKAKSPENPAVLHAYISLLCNCIAKISKERGSCLAGENEWEKHFRTAERVSGHRCTL